MILDTVYYSFMFPYQDSKPVLCHRIIGLRAMRVNHSADSDKMTAITIQFKLRLSIAFKTHPKR